MLAKGFSHQLGSVQLDCWDQCANLAIVSMLKISEVSTCKNQAEWEDSSPLSLGSEAPCLTHIWLWVALSYSETSLLFPQGKSCVVLFSGHIRLVDTVLALLQFVPAAEAASLLRLSLFHFGCLLFLAELSDALDFPRTGSSSPSP